LAETINPKSVAVVALGGIIGSLSRWGVSLGIQDHGFPWATLLVNYVGSAILMTLLLYVRHHKSPQWWWRPALGAGFCGGFTTYSAFALKMDQYFQAHNYSSALTYALASLLGTYIIVLVTHEALKNRWVKP
jgi:CrcB protein